MNRGRVTSMSNATDPGLRAGTLEIRLHGRGGQGIVTAAELLSIAAFLDGSAAQAFPMFGSERTGAPVMAFCRIAGAPITVREPVLTPDAVVVADATLMRSTDVLQGLRPRGVVLINSARTAGQLGIVEHDRSVVTVDATSIAREYLGRPVPNICLLGAFVAMTDAVTMASLGTAVRRRFAGAVGENNVRAAQVAHDEVKGRIHA